MDTPQLTYFKGKNVLITGGLGFIGSNLAIRLVDLGAHVTLVDAMIPDHGGNPFNIAPVEAQVKVNFGDVRDQHAMDWLVRGQDVVYHLAGQVSHIMSLQNPFPDIEYNIKGTTILMEALRHHNPTARFIYTGTRGQYGAAVKLPVDEEAPTNPKGLYEISNLTAEKIIKFYHDVHNIHGVMLRLTNIYGERAQMRHSHYGVVNWFIRLAIEGKTISVFGDGRILRDFLYVADCIEALLLAAIVDEGRGEIFNVGIDEPTSLRELVELIIEVAQSGSWEFTPPTRERAAQEPGNFYSDITKIRRVLGWEPQTPLRQGLAQTIEYYRAHHAEYWP